MSQFSFIVALVHTQNVLAYTKGLSVKLQGRYVDVVRAHRDIESVRTTLRGVRSRVDDFHAQVYEQVLMMGESIDVVESAPRQSKQAAAPPKHPLRQYKRNFTIPILNHLISELDVRFNAGSSQHVVEFMRLLPSEVVNTRSQLQFY